MQIHHIGCPFFNHKREYVTVPHQHNEKHYHNKQYYNNFNMRPVCRKDRGSGSGWVGPALFFVIAAALVLYAVSEIDQNLRRPKHRHHHGHRSDNHTCRQANLAIVTKGVDALQAIEGANRSFNGNNQLLREYVPS